MHTLRFRSVTGRALVALAAPLLLASPATFAVGPAAPTQSPIASEKAGAAKIAATSEDHLAKADTYRKEAAVYRAEAAMHRKMLEQYKEGFPATEGKIDEDTYVKKMRVHCEGYINKAEALATEAEKFADYHREQAADLRAPGLKAPVTPGDHLARAEEYRKKAAAYRAEAAMHRKMLADFRALAVTERADEDPGRKAMRIHCEGFINKAEELATEAGNFADFHRMRAAELKGK